MKKIYSFTVNKTEEVEEKVESINDAGAQVITINKVKRPVPHKFAVIKMPRTLKDDADLFYGTEYGKAIQKGMVPAAILSKRFENDDGIFGEKTMDKIKSLSAKFIEESKLYDNLLNKKDKTEEETQRLKELEKIIKETQDELREIEIRKNAYFANTAEVWARNKSIIWWFLFLSYKEKADGSLEPFFKGNDYKTKLEDYDNYNDDEDEFYVDVLTTFLSAISVYYSTGITKQEDIEKMIKEIDNVSESQKSS